MEQRSIAHRYYALVADKNGNLPPLHAAESSAGLAAAGLMDLLLHGVVSVEKKRVLVQSRTLPAELAHLAPLHAYLCERPRSLYRTISDHCRGRRSRQLMAAVGGSLLEQGLAVQGQGGLFGPQATYIPTETCRQEPADGLKTAAQQEGALNPPDAALLWCLKASGNLSRYFSKEECARLKKRFKEIERSPQHKEVMEPLRVLFRVLEDEAMIVMICLILFVYLCA